MENRPTGTITFLFTDIEGSTTLLERIGSERYTEILTIHQRLLRTAFTARGGSAVRTEGDSYFVAFQSAADGVHAALDAQRALAAHNWPDDIVVRVRMGLNTGEAILSNHDYQGHAVHEAQRICQVAHGEQVLLSRTTADLLVGMLPEGATLRALGDHRLKDLSKPTTIFQLLHPDLPDDFPRLRSMEALPNNLPVQLTPFIGREAELGDVKRKIEDARIVTLTGAGGCGKTRLALQAAADLLERFPDGVWLAELGPVTDPALVDRTVAAAIGARDEPGRPLSATLTDAIGTRSMMLILDNCEHLLRTCARLALTLVRACPNLHVLASSREALAVDGEVIWRVPSLQVPDIRSRLSVQELLRIESIRLFLDRAKAASPGFHLDEQGLHTLAQICHRLDGIPLALELAAARVRVLSVQQINERLTDRFRLLTGGRRGALPRQRTLHALVDWSYDLLAPMEQLLLRRLAVFAGGFDLDAAESVCPDDRLDAGEMLDILTALVDKSLVQVEENNGNARYRLLETIREYAEEKLGASEDPDAVRRRHRDYYLHVAEAAEEGLEGPEQVRWLELLETEHDNLRAALHWSVSIPEGAEAAQRLARAPWRFWQMHGYIGEGRAWLDAALRADGPSTTEVRARAYRAAGALALAHSDLDAAERMSEASLELDRSSGNEDSIAIALNNLGLVAQHRGDLDKARRLQEESLAITRRTKRDNAAAATLHNLGLVALLQGDYATARPCLEESLKLERKRGDLEGISRCLANLGNVSFEEHRTAEARAQIEEALQIKRELGDKRGIATSLMTLARVMRQDARPSMAMPLLAEAAALAVEADWEQGVAMVLEDFAGTAVDEGDDVKALTLYAAANALRAAIDFPRLPLRAIEHDEQLGKLRARVGEVAIEAERYGATLGADDAIAFAGAERPVLPPAVRVGQPAFVREGEIWTITRNGTTIRLKDMKGLGFLARLTSAPRTEFHVLDLAGAPEHIPRRAGPPLDPIASPARQNRLGDLLGGPGTGDTEDEDGIEQIDDDTERFEHASRHSVGLGGRDRRADVAERARVNITKAIKAAIDKIAEADEALGAHLRAAVRTGTFCSYAPERDRSL